MQENNIQHQYELIKLSEQHIPQTIAFTCNNFVASQPLSQHRKVKPQMFEKAFTKLIKDCVRSGYSFAFTKQQKIVALMLAVGYESYSEEVQGCEEMAPIQEIIQSIQNSYQPANPQKTLSIFVGCTLPEHTKRGLFSKLVQQTQKQAMKAGYREFLADCTNKASQSALLKLGYKEIRRINYNQFEFEGNFPFKNMGFPGAEALVLLSKVTQNK